MVLFRYDSTIFYDYSKLPTLWKTYIMSWLYEPWPEPHETKYRNCEPGYNLTNVLWESGPKFPRPSKIMDTAEVRLVHYYFLLLLPVNYHYSCTTGTGGWDMSTKRINSIKTTKKNVCLLDETFQWRRQVKCCTMWLFICSWWIQVHDCFFWGLQDQFIFLVCVRCFQ